MPGEKVTFEHNMSLLNGGMALQNYNQANSGQVELMRSECGTPMAIAGLLKAPLDILMDKLRGYIGVAMDLMVKPDVVLKACEALMPHICHFALAGADPAKQVPITIWMHRGCVPFISHEHFNNIYWPTLKPIVEEIWKQGHQVLFYAEGNWDEHLDAFAELPEKSIIYHVDQGDIFKAHKTFGHKFCLSGGIPNFLLSFKEPEDVRAHCKKVIDSVAADGGYIMDASAIIQDDARVENMQAMTEVTREYGIYRQSSVNKEPVLV
jgi:uroporphyrinogen-III decarboxylase